MSRSKPELVCPYPEDQQGLYLTWIRPNKTKLTVYFDKDQGKRLVKCVRGTEKRRIAARNRWLAMQKDKSTAPVPIEEPEPQQPVVPFRSLICYAETPIESTDDEYDTESSGSESDSDEDIPITPPKAPRPTTKCLTIPVNGKPLRTPVRHPRG